MPKTNNKSLSDHKTRDCIEKKESQIRDLRGKKAETAQFLLALKWVTNSLPAQTEQSVSAPLFLAAQLLWTLGEVHSIYVCLCLSVMIRGDMLET